MVGHSRVAHSPWVQIILQTSLHEYSFRGKPGKRTYFCIRNVDFRDDAQFLLALTEYRFEEYVQFFIAPLDQLPDKRLRQLKLVFFQRTHNEKKRRYTICQQTVSNKRAADPFIKCNQCISLESSVVKLTKSPYEISLTFRSEHSTAVVSFPA